MDVLYRQSRLPHLRSLGLSESHGLKDVIKLSEIAGSLTWLDIGCWGSYQEKVYPDHWIEAISKFPHLIAFHGVGIYSRHSRYNDTITAKLASFCPHLERVDMAGGRSEFVALYKDEHGASRWEARERGSYAASIP